MTTKPDKPMEMDLVSLCSSPEEAVRRALDMVKYCKDGRMTGPVATETLCNAILFMTRLGGPDARVVTARLLRGMLKLLDQPPYKLT